jgi:hypothetical protein
MALTRAQSEYKKLMGTRQLECHNCSRANVQFKESSLWGMTIFMCADTAACKEALRENNRASVHRILEMLREQAH